MARSKQALIHEAQQYFDELHERFPQVEVDEIIPERYAGADVWIALRAPGDLVSDIVEMTAKMDSKWADERGVIVLVTVSGRSGPVHV